MKLSRLLFASTMPFFVHATGITIRFAQEADYQSVCAFDRLVTYEYFKPLYKEHFCHIELGNNPDPYLEKELAADEQDFKQLLSAQNNRMMIALDNTAIVGLILFHRENTILELDLLLIHADYRKKGIGTTLVQAMLTAHFDAYKCIVYPIRGNEAAIKFYEKLGFINHGIPQNNKHNIYGIAYTDMYWQYERKL